MKPDEQHTTDEPSGEHTDYSPPAMTFLGTLAELTQQKEVGGADGATFLGLDIGPIS